MNRMTEPWLVSPCLTEERLQVISQEFVRVRAEALLEHRPEVGDDAWVYGCRAYRRTCHALKSLELSGRYPWLRVKEDGLACRIHIDDETLRFYCGDAEKPSARSLRRGLSDLLNQQQFSFVYDDFRDSGEDWFWLIAIEKHDDGTVLRVVVLQTNANGEVRTSWEVPTESAVASIGLVSLTTREAVELPPPAVGPKLITGKEFSVERPELADGTGA